MTASPAVNPLGVRLHRHEKLLAFGVATALLRVEATEHVRDLLTDLAEDQADVYAACEAMRDAAEHDHVTAALRCLRARRRIRVERREGCICGEPSAHPMRHQEKCPVRQRWDGSMEDVPR